MAKKKEITSNYKQTNKAKYYPKSGLQNDDLRVCMLLTTNIVSRHCFANFFESHV